MEQDSILLSTYNSGGTEKIELSVTSAGEINFASSSCLLSYTMGCVTIGRVRQGGRLILILMLISKKHVMLCPMCVRHG